MSDIVKSSLTALIAGERPSTSAIQACFTAIMDGDVSEAQMAAFLIALKMRGEQRGRRGGHRGGHLGFANITIHDCGKTGLNGA